MISYADARRVATFAAEVAQHLPGKFEVQTFPQKWERKAVVLVDGDERIALVHRTVSESCKDRISFIGLRLDADLSKPTCLSSLTRRSSHTTASLTRPPKAVAAQVSRNLLPHYRTQIESQKGMEAQREAQRVFRQAEATLIAAQLPGAEYIPTQTNRFFDSEIVRFAGPGGAHESLSVYSSRGGFSYTLTFGQNAAFMADLIALINKHSGSAPEPRG
ncbi:hypothetical protein E1286_38725 [Nonomuraea terrae]|uniref:Uncharacterized protein n=1 Tax=Nonomuraea terrae TaxID=2530383 RepID=A0A4R4XYA4_9ACTN|nr:hypothetical protein [Nonomuraea terrae]TDD36104.1 hypothetical protein E1286_38725 [Nonomuraea terrae]